MALDPLIGSALIGVGGSLLGGLFGSKENDRTNRINWEIAKNVSLTNQQNVRETNAMTKEIADRNFDEQREFAQQGIKWRVEDAKNAGLHPLAAIGAAGASHSPVSAVFDTPQTVSPPRVQADMSMPNAIQNAAAIVAGIEQNRANIKLANNQAELLDAQKRAVESDLVRRALGQDGPGKAITDMQSTGIGRGKVPDLYIKVRDNRTGKDVWMPNPDLGIEMPETVGLGYYADAKLYQLELASLVEQEQALKRQQKMDKNFKSGGGSFSPYNKQGASGGW